MANLILVRHGESIWNQKNIFTGWTDVTLSSKGIQEAKNAGDLLKNNNCFFQYAYTSFLKRAIYSLWYILKKIDLSWITVKKTWKLNERHYGDLQGYNKEKSALIYGEKQIQIWRRSFKTSPPKITIQDKRYPGKEQKYNHLNKNLIPLGESLLDTYNRVIPYWINNIYPYIKNNKSILIVAHGNSLRALIKYLEQISDKDIENLNIPTGNPLLYQFDKNNNISNKYYLK